jgi:hypothetical protein
VNSTNLWSLNYQLAIKVKFMFIFWSFSRPIVAIVQYFVSHSEEFAIYLYRHFFKRFLASLCEGNSKDCEFCFLVSVRRFSFILYTVRIFVLWPFTSFKTVLRTFSHKIWLADQGQRTKFFDFQRLVVCLYVAMFVWRWRELI